MFLAFPIMSSIISHQSFRKAEKGSLGQRELLRYQPDWSGSSSDPPLSFPARRPTRHIGHRGRYCIQPSALDGVRPVRQSWEIWREGIILTMMGLPVPSSPNLTLWSSLFVIKSLDRRYHITLIRPNSDPEISDIRDLFEGRGRELTNRISL